MLSTNTKSNFISMLDGMIKDAMSEASYDKTIKCTVVRLKDESVGEYLVTYQDIKFSAFSENNITYSENDGVYVLVPNNDFSKKKIILGSTNVLGQGYVYAITTESKYKKAGGNLIYSQPNYVNLYLNEDDKKILYNSDYGYSLVDDTIIKTQLGEHNRLLLSCTIKNDLQLNNIKIGNYGMYIICAYQTEYGAENLVRYVMDADSMSGNPYAYNDGFRNFIAFEHSCENFLRIEEIGIFKENFDELDDVITFSNLEIYGGDALDSSVYENYMVTITPDKYYFDDDTLSDEEDVVNLSCNLKKANALIQTGYKVYWFIQDKSVKDNSSDGYFKSAGGAEWRCLNTFEMDEDIKQWNSNETISISRDNFQVLNTQIKCAIEYDSKYYNSTVNIQNLLSTYSIKIVSSDEITDYNEGNGTPELSCEITKNGIKQDQDNFTYSWYMYDDYNNQIDLGDSVSINFNMQQIDKNGIVYCDVYKNSAYLGNAQIELSNSSWINLYSLMIENGSQSFLYDSDGISPCANSKIKKQEIKKLSFHLYDRAGEEIDKSLCEINWIVPENDTLLLLKDSSSLNQDNLDFSIATAYNVDCDENQIILEITYDGSVIRAETQFNFMQSGDVGNAGNGTVIRIANISEDDVLLVGKDGTLEGSKEFRLDVFKDGEEYNGDEIVWSLFEFKDNENYDWFFESTQSNKIILKDKIDNIDNLKNSTMIIRCSAIVDEIKYFAVYPLTVIFVNDKVEEHMKKIKLSSGYRTVKYNKSGYYPSYDKTDTEFKIANIDNIKLQFYPENIMYEWELQDNILIPSSIYDSTKNRIGLTGEVIYSDNYIGDIYIPIYCYLNRYELETMNAWDGNSIDINNDGKYILSPVIAAGKKEKNNTFTGIVMGKEMDDSKNEDELIEGLIGYNNGAEVFVLDTEGNFTLGAEGSGQIKIGYDDASGEACHAKISNGDGSNYWDLTEKQFVFKSDLKDKNQKLTLVMDDEDGVYTYISNEVELDNEDGSNDKITPVFSFDDEGVISNRIIATQMFEIGNIALNITPGSRVLAFWKENVSKMSEKKVGGN